MKLTYFLALLVLLCKPVFAISCYHFISANEHSLPQSPAEKMREDFHGRAMRLELVLDGINPQAYRQMQKVRKSINKIINLFEAEGTLSDSNLIKMMSLMERFAEIEVRFINMEFAQILKPNDLSRYLHTEEALVANFDYTVELPGLGPVKVRFSKNVAQSFSYGSKARTVLFPYLFRGIVGKKGQDGLKFFNGNQEAFKDGVLYRMFELKNSAGHRDRIIGFYSDDGVVYLHKHISNHNRVEYVSVNGFLEAFLNTF